LAHSFRDFDRRILPNGAASFVLDTIRTGLTFFRTLPGVDFEEAWGRRVEGVIDPKTGLKAFFISAPDLIVAKIVAGRPQDIADVEAIRKAAEAQMGRDD
jgi:hypothetical protein